MRIVVWNCKMALARKRQHLYGLLPDIAVIPECSKDSLELCRKDGFDGRWFGDNPLKGLGVLVAKPLRITRTGKPRNRWVVPLSISGGPCDIRLIAVWTMPVLVSQSKSYKVRKARSYIGQLYEAVVHHPQWFAGKPSIVCGDFNSNTIWDQERPPRKDPLGKVKTGNHSFVVGMLSKHKLTSAYHHFFSERQGQESRPTYYSWHHKNRGYHIDYVFLPSGWSSQIKSVEVGDHAAWSKLSDHVPLCVDVPLPAS